MRYRILVINFCLFVKLLRQPTSVGVLENSSLFSMPCAVDTDIRILTPSNQQLPVTGEVDAVGRQGLAVQFLENKHIFYWKQLLTLHFRFI